MEKRLAYKSLANKMFKHMKMVTGGSLILCYLLVLSQYYDKFLANDIGISSSLDIDNISSLPSTINSIQTEKKYAYALLLDTKELVCPARILASRLKRLDPQSDVVVFTVSLPNIDIPAATKILPIKPASNLGKWQWKNTFSKFQAGRLHEYDAVMFLDMDNIVLQSPRYLFDLMSPSKDVAAPAAYWLGQPGKPYYMSGGPMIFRPSKALDNRLAKVLDGNGSSVTHDSEMNWFNEEFEEDLQVLDYMIPDGVNNKGEAVQKLTYVLNDEFKFPDKMFILGEMMGFKHPSEVLEKSTMVHFIASWKPYKNDIRKKIQKGEASNETKYLIALYDAEKLLVC